MKIVGRHSAGFSQERENKSAHAVVASTFDVINCL